MRDYEQRRQAVSEMHLRRWPELRVPSNIVQWVLKVEDDERDEELTAIEAVADPADIVGNPSHRDGKLAGDIRFTWERQSEGSSLTLFGKGMGHEAFLKPSADADLQSALDWAQALPGKIVRSTRIWIAESDAEVEAVLPQLDLNRHELVSSRIGEHIRIWSDFRIKDDGFGRLLFALAVLGALEHLFLALPFRDGALWGWALPTSRKAAVAADRPHSLKEES